MRSDTNIAVLGGTGAEGGAIALRLAVAGYSIVLGSRERDKAEKAAEKIRFQSGSKKVRGDGNLNAAAAAAEVVILTVPYAAQATTVREVGEALTGKILVDATVPLVPPRISHVQLPNGGSSVAAIQELLGDRVSVVSAFQNVSAHLLRDLDHAVDCDVLVCGNSIEARETVINLARSIGLRGLHAGPICNSAAAEALTSVLISINRLYKAPGGAGLKITGLDDRLLPET